MKLTRSAPNCTRTTAVTRLRNGRKRPCATGVMEMRGSSPSRQSIRRLMPFSVRTHGANDAPLTQPISQFFLQNTCQWSLGTSRGFGHWSPDGTSSDVTHLSRGHVEIGVQLHELLVGQLVTDTGQGGAHRRNPGVANLFGDAKRSVANAQARVAAFLHVVVGTAPVLNEEERQMPLRLGQIFGVHGTQQLILLDRVVKAINQSLEERLTAQLVVERRFHFTTLRDLAGNTAESLTEPLQVSALDLSESQERRAGVAQW